MNDFLDKPIEVGDEVAFIAPGYRFLKKGKIVKITKCFVFIGNPHKYDPDRVIRRDNNTVIKI